MISVFKWYDYLIIWWHANILSGAVLGLLIGDLYAGIFGAVAWYTWNLYEGWRGQTFE